MVVRFFVDGRDARTWAVDQPMRIRRLTLIFDLVILVLTIVVIIPLAQIPGRHQRLARRGIARWSGLVWRSRMEQRTSDRE